MAAEQVLESLALDAGQAVVAVATTDAWSWAKKAFAHFLGHGDTAKAERYEGRLEATRRELAALPLDELELVSGRLSAAWQARVLDVLEEQPGMEADLRSLLKQVQVALPSGPVMGTGHGAAAGRDMNITASGNAVAAGTVRGSVSTANPTVPGPADT